MESPDKTAVLPYAPPVAYRFDRFELLPEAEELRKNGTRIHLPPQPFRVLLLLVQRAGQIVTREEIQEALWGAEVFVDFEQGINTAIRRIRFALNDHAETPRFLQTLPRRGYCFLAPVERVEAPVTPPPEIEPLRPVEPWVPEPPLVIEEERPRRSFARFAAALVVLGMLFFSRAPHEGAGAAAPRPVLRISIGAVAADRTWTAPVDPRRIEDELQTHLSRLQPHLVGVVEEGPSDITVETSLQDGESAVRVSARIVETGSGKVVWSETFNREGDAGDFPLEIALRITQAVGSRYIPEGREEPLVRTPVAPAALALYREARVLASRPVPQQDLDAALVRLQKAVQLEPEFAEAWSAIGDIWSERAEAWMGESRAVALTQARIALERSLALDSKGAEALNDYGRLLMQHDRDYAAAETWLRRAIAADPDYIHPYFNLAVLLSAMGQHDAALASFRQLQLRDPNSFVPSVNLAFLYLMAQRPDDAMAEYRAAVLVDRNPFQTRWGIMWSAMATQRWDVAARSLATILEEPVDLGDQAGSGARYREEFRRLEPILLKRESVRRLDPYVLACYYSQLHDADRAFAALDRSIQDRSTLAIYTFVDPRLEFIRTDPRFEARLERLGFRR
ncbi:MAG TPA: winged helix-turn-helix domain-containing protein [Thermoanaerobaculia bacterium]